MYEETPRPETAPQVEIISIGRHELVFEHEGHHWRLVHIPDANGGPDHSEYRLQAAAAGGPRLWSWGRVTRSFSVFLAYEHAPGGGSNICDCELVQTEAEQAERRRRHPCGAGESPHRDDGWVPVKL